MSVSIDLQRRMRKHRPAPKPTPPTADVASCVDDHQHRIESISDLRHVPLGQGHHQSDLVWRVQLVLAGQQLVVVVVDLADPCTDYMVVVAEVDILEGVHYNQIGMAQVGRYCTARERLPGMLPGLR